MRKIFFIASTFCLFCGITFICIAHGQAASPLLSFSTYQGHEPNFTIEIPSDWNFLGERDLQGIGYGGGKRYRWKGPQNSTFVGGYTSLQISIVPSRSVTNVIDSFERYAEFLEKDRLSSNAEMLNRSTIQFAGHKAREIMVRYPSLLGMHSFQAPHSFRKVVWAVAQVQDYYVDVRYSAEESDFEKFLQTYGRVRETLRFE